MGSASPLVYGPINKQYIHSHLIHFFFFVQYPCEVGKLFQTPVSHKEGDSNPCCLQEEKLVLILENEKLQIFP